EQTSRQFKRSIYVSKDIKAGEEFTTENIKIIRPGDGLEPKHIDKVLGKVAAKDLVKGTPLSWSILV
ncbi:MAG: SAF domain-containing protein, partial [Bacteroidota bacterium]